ncbi:Uncharacterised protein [uncultured archaeon]|nr:Uncharacterised protein [uncultured archaeon]
MEASWIDKLYTHYLSEDLAYLFSGGLFILIIEYTIIQDYNLQQQPFPPQQPFYLLTFFALSYLLGIVFYDIGIIFLVYTGYHESYDDKKEQIKMDNIREVIYSSRMKFMHITLNSVGVSSLVGGFLALLYYRFQYYFSIKLVKNTPYIYFWVICVIFGIYMILSSIKTWNHIRHYYDEETKTEDQKRHHSPLLHIFIGFSILAVIILAFLWDLLINWIKM